MNDPRIQFDTRTKKVNFLKNDVNASYKAASLVPNIHSERIVHFNSISLMLYRVNPRKDLGQLKLLLREVDAFCLGLGLVGTELQIVTLGISGKY